MRIDNYGDFLRALRMVGFSTSGGRAEGGIALSKHFTDNIRWHTGADTDPWLWRARVLEEPEPIAYAKLFEGKGGFITREWYPHFLSVRRDGMDCDDMYQAGILSSMAHRVYRAIEEGGALAYHEIKRAIGATREDESKFSGALVRLQMKMLITISGHTYKFNKQGLPYGWEVSVFTTPERFWGDSDILDEADDLGSAEAYQQILDNIRSYNPDAGDKEMSKFISA